MAEQWFCSVPMRSPLGATLGGDSGRVCVPTENSFDLQRSPFPLRSNAFPGKGRYRRSPVPPLYRRGNGRGTVRRHLPEPSLVSHR
jgi:hypothetical protein